MWGCKNVKSVTEKLGFVKKNRKVSKNGIFFDLENLFSKKREMGYQHTQKGEATTFPKKLGDLKKNSLRLLLKIFF